MGFSFPFGSQVVELTFGQFSDAFEFSSSVPVEVNDTYVRIIALWRDNQALGGEAPTIEILSGAGGFTPLNVTPHGTETKIPIIGTGAVVAGMASCQREDHDIYFVHISDLAEGNGPWHLRIKNNDPQTLHFVAVSSTDPDQTLQPWMVWGATPGSFTTVTNPDDLNFALPQRTSTHSVTVRNLGTEALTFAEQAGVSIGPPTDSPAVIITMPSQIDPHGVAAIVFGVHTLGADAEVTVSHTMATNDQRHTAILSIHVSRTNFPPPPPPPPPPCNIDHCDGYLPNSPGGPCQQPGCGHRSDQHGLGSRCGWRWFDQCPGFVTADGRHAGSGPCAQLGCGHPFDDHGESLLSSPDPPMPCSRQQSDGCTNFDGTNPQRCANQACKHPLSMHSI
jgi:hypothetical protein